MEEKVPARIASFTEDHYAAVKAEIDTQSDRGAAILAGSLLDEHLRWAIDRRFIVMEANTSKSIFEGLGPLASFEARRRLGFALGLYDRVSREELKIVGQIRNRFAHTIEPIGFNDPVITQYCQDLAYPKLHADLLGASAKNREKYLHSCWILRAVVTNEVMVEDRPSGPRHEILLAALAESLAAASPHDRSGERHPSPIQSVHPRRDGK